MITFKDFIHNTPDFPKKGVMFRDVSPLLEHHFTEMVQGMTSLFSEEEWADVTTLAGIDSRGFIVASALAIHLNKGLTLIRKKGKLPPPVVGQDYQLEYGTDKLEMKPGKGKVMLVDDVLATGGTMQAAANLCQTAGYDVKGMATLIDLKFLNTFNWEGQTVRSLVQYNE